MQLLLAHFLRLTGGDAFPGGPDAIRERLRAFLASTWSSSAATAALGAATDASPVYRMAVAAPFWLGALVEATPFSGATTRCIASSVLSHFTSHGALEDGIPPLGWYGVVPRPWPTPTARRCRRLMTSEAFVGLLVPPDDPPGPMWSRTEPSPGP